jgi:hypothetical protein
LIALLAPTDIEGDLGRVVAVDSTAAQVPRTIGRAHTTPDTVVTEKAHSL